MHVTGRSINSFTEFCTSTRISGYKEDMSCPYNITYGNASTIIGSYAEDYHTFKQVNGDPHATPENSSMIGKFKHTQHGMLLKQKIQLAKNKKGADLMISLITKATNVMDNLNLSSCGKRYIWPGAMVEILQNKCADSVFKAN